MKAWKNLKAGLAGTTSLVDVANRSAACLYTGSEIILEYTLKVAQRKLSCGILDHFSNIKKRSRCLAGFASHGVRLYKIAMPGQKKT